MIQRCALYVLSALVDAGLCRQIHLAQIFETCILRPYQFLGGTFDAHFN